MAEDELPMAAHTPGLSGRTILTWAAVALLTMATASLYQHAFRRNPYYFNWDMDLSTAIDTVLIRSGKTPDHINHTAFGMYLVLKGAVDAGARLGLLSATTLAELDRSLNPLACMAELTDFLRRLSPWLSLATVLCLWASVCLLLRPGRVIAFAAILVLASQECFYYHSSMVRTGLYSVLFWSAGVLSLVVAARSKRQGRLLAWLFVGGALLGLSYVTKLQAMVYVVIPVMVFFLALDSRGGRAARGELRPWQRIAAVAGSGAALLVFSVLLILSACVAIPLGKALFTREFGLTKHAVVLLLVLGGLCAVQYRLLVLKRTSSRWFVTSAMLTFLLTGALAAFALHLLMFSSVSLSWSYLLWDFKILFLRPLYTDLRGPLFYAERLFRLIGYCPVVFVVHLAALGALGVAARRGPAGERRRFYLCVASSAVLLLHLLIGVRFCHKDLIWVEPATNLLSLVYWGMFLSRDIGLRRVRLGAAGCAMLLLVAANGMHLAAAGRRIDANLHQYGYRASKWHGSVYGDNHMEYRSVMNGRWPRSRGAVRAIQRQALDHQTVRRMVSFVFRNQRVSLRNVGVLWEGLPVWTDALAYKIATCPAWLRGAMVVDTAAMHADRTGFLSPDAPNRFGGGRYEFAPGVHEPLLAILPRSDLRVLLFLEAEDFTEAAGLTDKQEIASMPRITVTDGRTTRTFRGLPLSGYTVLPVLPIEGRHFFVIYPPFSSGPTMPEAPRARSSSRPNATQPASRPAGDAPPDSRPSRSQRGPADVEDQGTTRFRPGAAVRLTRRDTHAGTE